MKLILLIITSILSFPAFAQYYQQYKFDSTDNKKKEEQSEPYQPPRTTPETVYYYLKSGYSVGAINDEASSYSFGAIGTRRYSDEFYYGTDFSSHFGNKKMRTTLIDVTFGYHLLTTNNRIKPYIGASFGYASQSDSSDKKRPEGNGIAVGLDIGFTIYQKGPFMVNSGFNYHSISYNKKETGNSNFQDIYMMFAVAF